MNKSRAPVIVVGSGIAGLLAALKVSRFSPVTVVTKKSVREANTNYAQGGIAAALDPRDSTQAHLKDTLRCGDGLCDENVARKIIRDAPELIAELESLGVPFTKKNNRELSLGLEGGHSARRIVHATDFTGRALESALADRLKERGVRVLENTQVLDLILQTNPSLSEPARNRVLGVSILGPDGKQKKIKASAVILASGGAGKVYLYTTNPDIATGDGMAMAWRAGLSLANMEFVQFHPTCLYHAQKRTFLISEAVRGEGARLKTISGRRFMKDYDSREELAPRDIVARAIDAEMKKTGDEYVFLDITHKKEAWLKRRFPNIFQRLKELGFDMARQPVPVVPAAHYFCGGVQVDGEGRTGMPGLYAIGEAACSHFHGANRLASNSLLEACAFANYASAALEKDLVERERARSSEGGFIPTRWGTKSLAGSDLNTLIAHNWDEVRRLMASYVGIVRSRERLLRAQRRLSVIESEIRELVSGYAPTHDLAELVNITQVAGMIIASALRRPESRGLHYMLDFPQKNPKLTKPTVIRRKSLARTEMSLADG